MSLSLQALIKLHIAVLLFGISGLFGKLIPIDPSLIVFGRTLTGSLILLSALLISGRLRQLSIFGRGKVDILMGGLLALHWITFFQSIQVSSVAIGLLAFSSYPVFVTLLEPVIYREPLRKLDILTTCGVVFGISVILPLGSMSLDSGLVQGVAWGVFSAFLFSVLSLMNRSRVQKTDPMVLTCLQNIGAMLAALIIIPKTQVGLLVDYSLELFALGALCTTLPLMLFLNSLRYLKTQLVSLISCLEPVYGIILAALVLSEVPSLRTVFGGLVILIAITIGTVSGRSRSGDL